ncbi:MAG: hypothetical protein IJ689_05665 [Alphaproteobacteria bacterium]|nr:hypothetical protein [Alphaproteobacteria bacterium]
MNEKKLRLGIDFHGVITENPVFFRDFCDLALSLNYEVHIVSGGPCQVEKEFLKAWHICYTELFCLLDYFASRGQIEYFENGNFKVRDELWNEAKAQYCAKHRIDIQIDDTARYFQSFTTPFCLYDAKKHSGRLNGHLIDFKQSPAQSLTTIEKILKEIPEGKRDQTFGDTEDKKV